MSDVTKAILLPDLNLPPAGTMRNLAVYWDEIVYPVYDEFAFDSDDVLVREGVVRMVERDVPAHRLFPTSEPFDEGKKWGYDISRDADGEIQVELVPHESPGAPFREMADLTDEELEASAAIDLAQHLGFVDDSLSIAAENNLAPISHSLGGHLAAVIGSSQERSDALPSREAALLSVVVEAFGIDPGVSSEQIVAFREKYAKSQARFRASLVDLAARLRAGSSPIAMLAEARDTYKNRVEPALGDLEEALKESRINFFLKSLVGATAIAVAPIEPVSTSAGAARVVGQGIDYSYSKSRLAREHPYGYLHEVGRQLGPPTSGGESMVVDALSNPRRALSEMWLAWWREGREWDRRASDP